MRFYISIEKNIKSFELYRALWKKLGVDGIRVETMTDGIKKAIEIEKSPANELYFIDIVADDIDFMPQLRILSDETKAPILIATSNPTADEHYEALNNGADFYGKCCEKSEQNINAVIALINSMERRSKKNNTACRIFTYKDILISKDIHQVFVSDKEIQLTRTEMEILYYLMINRGLILTHEKIKQYIWPDDDEVSHDMIYNNIKRLRDKMRSVSQKEYIENVRDVGYRLTRDDTVE